MNELNFLIFCVDRIPLVSYHEINTIVQKALDTLFQNPAYQAEMRRQEVEDERERETP